jgi:hypothetical protein
MLKKMAALFLMLAAVLLIMSCSTMSSINRTYSYTLDALFGASVNAVAQLKGKIIFANKGTDSGIVRFSIYNGIATTFPDEVTVNMTRVSDTVVNVTIDVQNSSPQLIDWKSKETTLSRFEKALYNNLGSDTK